MRDIAILIPIRNEAEGLQKTVERLKNQPFFKKSRILLIYDESEDNTFQVAQKLSQMSSNVQLVHNHYPRGFGWSLKTGFESVEEKYIVVMMADLCDDPSTIPKMLKKAKSGYHIVCGSRFMKGAEKIGGPPSKTFFSRSIGLMIHYLIGLPTVDCTNAFKLYQRDVIDNILIEGKLSFAISMKMILLAYFHGYKITEVPTVWKGRSKGKSRFNVRSLAPVYLVTFAWAIVEAGKKRWI